MNGRLALSFAVAALILGVGGLYVVWHRLGAVERRLERQEGGRARTPGTLPTGPARPETDEADPLQSKDPIVKLDHLVQTADKAEGDAYEYYTDLSGDLHALKREISQIKSTLRQVIQGLNRPGGEVVGGIGWGLVPRERPVDEATANAYRAAAETLGVKVEEGRVTVRGLLNMSPNTAMPIEYFVTRYPEAAHETLVHLLGNRSLEDLRENPWGGLKGLATALYKGMIAAGFKEGVGTHVDPASDPKDPKWILATGDKVYVYVRYERGGATHLARATDWVLEDPDSQRVLPHDCFRFTGSARGEDPDTGDEILAAEARGHIASVWPDASAMVEVALESSFKNMYSYNFSRIPKFERGQTLFLDLIFSKTPMEPEGEGAPK